MVSWVGEAGCGYHCESDLAGLAVTVPLYFRSELFTQQCLEERKSAQNLNLPNPVLHSRISQIGISLQAS